MSKHVHYWPELRSKHLSLTSLRAGSLFLVQQYKFDFDPLAIPPNAQIKSAGLWKSIFLIFRARPEVVEIPEPLYYRYLLKTVLLVFATNVLATFRKNPPKFVTFCIENGFRGLKPKRLFYIPEFIWLATVTPLVLYLVKKLDKVAFGSESAEITLSTWLPQQQKLDLVSKSRTFTQLPSKCDCNPELVKVKDSVLFLGELSARKGMPQLIEAWEEHSKEFPKSTLTLAGVGPLENKVIELASRNKNVNYLGKVNRENVHRLLRVSQLVVLPSRRFGTWREQIGLPLGEGLSHLCSVIAPEDSGLAPFLAENSQQVLAWDYSVEDLVAALRTATVNPVFVSALKLPTRDQRDVAEEWLLSGVASDE